MGAYLDENGNDDDDLLFNVIIRNKIGKMTRPCITSVIPMLAKQPIAHAAMINNGK